MYLFTNIYIYIPWASKTILCLAFGWGPFFAVTAYTLPSVALFQVKSWYLRITLAQFESEKVDLPCHRCEYAQEIAWSTMAASANPNKWNALQLERANETKWWTTHNGNNRGSWHDLEAIVVRLNFAVEWPNFAVERPNFAVTHAPLQIGPHLGGIWNTALENMSGRVHSGWFPFIFPPGVPNAQIK